MSSRILVVEDDRSAREEITAALGEAGYDVKSAAYYPDAFAILKREAIDLAIVDLRLGDPADSPANSGDHVLDYVWELGILAVVVTGFPGSPLEVRSRAESRGGTVYEIVDKKRFHDEPDYLRNGFIHTVQMALEAVADIRESEGLTEPQQQRLEELAARHRRRPDASQP